MNRTTPEAHRKYQRKWYARKSKDPEFLRVQAAKQRARRAKARKLREAAAADHTLDPLNHAMARVVCRYMARVWDTMLKDAGLTPFTKPQLRRHYRA